MKAKMMNTRTEVTGGFSYRPDYPQTLTSKLGNLREIRLPRVLRLIGGLLAAGFVLSMIGLVFIPWMQTTSGMGRVSTLDPGDRIQSLSALVSGRVAEWYVQDGDSVRAGDPIVRIMDLDDSLVSRLQAQLDAAQRKVAAAQEAANTAELDRVRRGELLEQGLVSRLDYEQARIRVQQMRISEEEALGELNQAQVNLSRQGSQLVVAPRDGTILHVEAGAEATVVSAGKTLATFMPTDSERVVEIYIDGRDVGLVYPGRQVRLEFETWPAFQFSGIPEFAVGTFAGEVIFVEPGASTDGRFRVLVAEPDPDPSCTDVTLQRPGLNRAGNCGWPPVRFVPLGASTRGWILLDRVPLGYELWRLLNNFPPGNRSKYLTASMTGDPA